MLFETKGSAHARKMCSARSPWIQRQGYYQPENMKNLLKEVTNTFMLSIMLLPCKIKHLAQIVMYIRTGATFSKTCRFESICVQSSICNLAIKIFSFFFLPNRMSDIFSRQKWLPTVKDPSLCCTYLIIIFMFLTFPIHFISSNHGSKICQLSAVAYWNMSM